MEALSARLPAAFGQHLVGSGAWTRGEVFTGGKHLATYVGGATGAIHFNHTDWLGTERVRSDKSGAACETITSLLCGDPEGAAGRRLRRLSALLTN
jgi:hypothetical protein